MFLPLSILAPIERLGIQIQRTGTAAVPALYPIDHRHCAPKAYHTGLDTSSSAKVRSRVDFPQPLLPLAREKVPFSKAIFTPRTASTIASHCHTAQTDCGLSTNTGHMIYPPICGARKHRILVSYLRYLSNHCVNVPSPTTHLTRQDFHICSYVIIDSNHPSALINIAS